MKVNILKQQKNPNELCILVYLYLSTILLILGASLLFGSWEQMIRNLFSRRTAGYFDWPILLCVLGFFIIFSSWTSITSISSGLLIPQLL